MGELFHHRPARRIRQRRQCCTQSIHNRMVVDYSQMSTTIFATKTSVPWSLNPTPTRDRPPTHSRNQISLT